MLGDGFAILLVGTAVLSFFFAGLAWRKRSEPGGKPLVVYNLAIGVAMVAYAGDIVSTTAAEQTLLVSVWFPLQALVATTWMYIAIEYAGIERWSNRRTVAFLWAEPVVVGVLGAVPATRSLLFELPETGVEGSLFFVGAASGPLLPIHYVFLFVVMLAGTLLFVRLFLRSKYLYRVQSVAVAVAAVSPWTLILIQAIGVAPVEDPSAVAFAVSGMALTTGLYRVKFLDPVPAAREQIVAEMGDGAVVIDTDGIVSSINPAAQRLLAADEETVGMPVEELFPGWSRISAGDPADERTDEWQQLGVTVDGTERFLEVQVSPFRDRFDRVIGRLVVIRDVTERTRRERNLARFKTIFDSVTDRVYVLDDQERFVMVNEPFASLVGVEPVQLEGEPFDSILPADTDTEEWAIPETGDSRELTIQTRDGERVPCELQRAPISFEGLESGSVGILRDISQRRQIESSLQRTTERLETIVEASPLAIVATDVEGSIEVWNSAATETFGWDAAAVRGEFPPFVPDESEARVRSLSEQVLDGEQITGLEIELTKKNGSVIDASVSMAPLTDDSGTTLGLVAIIADITDQKERERRLQRQTERLEDFAGLIAHDLRSPLQVGSSHLELLAAEADLDEAGREHLEEATSALERMETLIEETLTLAREGKDIGDTRPLALEDIATRAWGKVSTTDATLVVEDHDETTIQGDPSRVQELFENLFRNAIEHGMPPERPSAPAADGSGVPDHGPRLTVRVVVSDDGFAVEDDGVGIDDTDIDKLFEPGFTTAPDGTGFGLAIVDRIASAHGWTVTVAEGPGGGTRFEFETA